MFVILETGWLVMSFLKNSDKTEIFVIVLNISKYNLSINGFTVTSSSTVKNLFYIS